MKGVFKKLAFVSLLGATSILAACNSDDKKAADSADLKKIRIGTTVGDFADMVTDSIQPQLAKKGYDVELVVFTDYVLPNRALADGSLEINTFQHLPYLNSFKTLNELDLTEVFQIPTGPLGIYSGKKDDLSNIAQGAKFAMPNDPSNFSRSLALLVDANIITLKPGTDSLKATKNDIAENPYNIEIVMIEAPQLPRVRPDVDFVVIPGNYAASSNIPFSDALFADPGFVFINWAAVKTSDLNAPWLQDVKDAYNSDEFKAYAAERFAGYKYPQIWEEAK
ncbi:MetQ/NlpA family ABC transporter substrate-binding protein [Ignatzschineria sp. LJL83]